jgi:hypothetical protein
VTKDGGSVLVPHVAELTVYDGRIDIVPEDIHQFFIGDLPGVIEDLYRVGVIRAAGGHLLVARVLHLAACVPGGGRDNPGEFVKRGSMHQKQPPAKSYLSLDLISGSPDTMQNQAYPRLNKYSPAFACILHPICIHFQLKYCSDGQNEKNNRTKNTHQPDDPKAWSS